MWDGLAVDRGAHHGMAGASEWSANMVCQNKTGKLIMHSSLKMLKINVET